MFQNARNHSFGSEAFEIPEQYGRIFVIVPKQKMYVARHYAICKKSHPFIVSTKIQAIRNNFKICLTGKYIYPINDCKRYKICSTWIVEFIFSAQDSMAFNQRYLILDFYKNQLMVGDSQSVGTRAGRSRQRGIWDLGF